MNDQTSPVSKRKRRLFTPSDRRAILAYREKNGMAKTLKHFNLHESIVYRWLSAEKKQQPKQDKPKRKYRKPVAEKTGASVDFALGSAYLQNAVRLIEERIQKDVKTVRDPLFINVLMAADSLKGLFSKKT